MREVTKGGNIKVPDTLEKLYENFDLKEMMLSEEKIKESIFIKKRSENFVDKVM